DEEDVGPGRRGGRGGGRGCEDDQRRKEGGSVHSTSPHEERGCRLGLVVVPRGLRRRPAGRHPGGPRPPPTRQYTACHAPGPVRFRWTVSGAPAREEAHPVALSPGSPVPRRRLR